MSSAQTHLYRVEHQPNTRQGSSGVGMGARCAGLRNGRLKRGVLTVLMSGCHKEELIHSALLITTEKVAKRKAIIVITMVVVIPMPATIVVLIAGVE